MRSFSYYSRIKIQPNVKNLKTITGNQDLVNKIYTKKEQCSSNVVPLNAFLLILVWDARPPRDLLGS